MDPAFIAVAFLGGYAVASFFIIVELIKYITFVYNTYIDPVQLENITRLNSTISNNAERIKTLNKTLEKIKSEKITIESAKRMIVIYNEILQILMNSKQAFKYVVSSFNKVISAIRRDVPGATLSVGYTYRYSKKLEEYLEKLVMLVGQFNMQLDELNKSGKSSKETIEEDFGIILPDLTVGFGRKLANIK